jgi:hypothetical protein
MMASTIDFVITVSVGAKKAAFTPYCANADTTKSIEVSDSASISVFFLRIY